MASQVNIPPWAIMTAFPMPSPKPLCDFRLSLGDFPFFFLEIVRRALCFCRRLSAVRWSPRALQDCLKVWDLAFSFFWGGCSLAAGVRRPNPDVGLKPPLLILTLRRRRRRWRQHTAFETRQRAEAVLLPRAARRVHEPRACSESEASCAGR